MTMLVLITFYVMATVDESLGSYDLAKLLKEYPTWSFELESAESLIKNKVSALKDADPLMTEEILRRKLNLISTSNSTHIVRKVGDPKWIQDPKKLPLYFDAREKWKNCADMMSTIQDEGVCNADSIMAVASVMADRYCIFTNGTSKETLSAEMLAGCAEYCTHESYEFYSWSFATNEGIPTGGPKGSNKGCVPYKHAPCLHGNVSSITGNEHDLTKLKPCSEDFTYDHDCPKKCTNPNYPKPLDQDLRKCKVYYALSEHEFCIRNEILTYGSVVTSFTLYDDLYEKPNGIYSKKKGRKFVTWEKFLKLIGWGEEDGVKYWLAVNSWDQWGDKVFKFPRGVNYDYIEYVLTTCVYDDRNNLNGVQSSKS